MHGETQNVNESLNNLIWTKCPKQVYVGNSTLKMSVASAVINYNDGATRLLPVLIKLGVNCGFYTTAGSKSKDIHRIKQSNHITEDSVKKRRKKLRAIRKGYNDKDKFKDGYVMDSIK